MKQQDNFKDQEQQANTNISKIFNPVDKYERLQQEILRSVFQ
jgi:hypothetical protein